MQEDELDSRQDRIVYLLMSLLALAGLAWTLGQHANAAS